MRLCLGETVSYLETDVKINNRLCLGEKVSYLETDIRTNNRLCFGFFLKCPILRRM